MQFSALNLNSMCTQYTYCINLHKLVSHVSESARCRLRLKCDGTRAETRFRLSAKRTSPFKLAGASVQSPTGSRGVRISASNAGYTMFRGSVKSTGYPLHSPVSPSLPFPCVTVCHQVSTGLYRVQFLVRCTELSISLSYEWVICVCLLTLGLLLCCFVTCLPTDCTTCIEQ
jgi:hypothetical protein